MDSVANLPEAGGLSERQAAVAPRPPAAPRRWRSLRARMVFVAAILFTAITVLALAAFSGANNSIEVSDTVRERWLPNTRLLGDLNNYTSDYRTAEANELLATSAAERADSEREMRALIEQINRARRGYTALDHNAVELDLYRQFDAAWTEHLATAARVADLVATGRTAEAADLYRTDSKRTYDLTSDLLGQLTDYNVIQAAKASERSALANRRARQILIAATVVAGLALMVTVAYVRRSVSEPLLELAEQMRQLAANNTDIEQRHGDRTDEIGEMARAIRVFRGNAIALLQSQRGLAQQAAMLEEKLEHERELTRQRQDFVSMAAHEFRTPLTQIDAQAQRITRLRATIAPDELNERAGRVRASVTRLVTLLDNLLDWSRLMSGEARLFFHAEPMDLSSMLREVCRVYREISPEAQIVESFSPMPLMMSGDRKLLFQAVGNLLSNAIKYSPNGTDVIVRARQENGGVRIEVVDSGIGIPPDDLPRVFTQFYRGSNVSGIVGAGIGLFFVATVARLHGGQVAVESREGNGTRFTLSLPAIGRDGTEHTI